MPAPAKPEITPRPFKKSSGHPFLLNWPKGVFCPHAVGVVPYYPKTEESFQRRIDLARDRMNKRLAEGRKMPTRAGVADGFGKTKRRDSARHFRNLAVYEAKIIMDVLRQKDLLVEPDNVMANEALEVAIELHRDKTVGNTIRLAAARTVLEWTRAKPAQRIDTTVRTAEAFLQDLVEDAKANIPRP